MSKKNKLTVIKTPRGVFKYPRLDQPYKWSRANKRSVPDPDGQYEVVVVLNAKDAKPVVNAINGAITASGIDPENIPYKNEVGDDKKPTGNVEFKFRDYGKTRDGKKKVIPIYDPRGNLVRKKLEIYGGTEGKIEAYVTVTEMGARLSIMGIQILSLKSAPSRFEAEEGDFNPDDYADDDGDDDNNDNNDSTDNGTYPEDDDVPF